MEKKVIETKNAPKPVGHYSQAIFIGEMMFISGQIGIDPSNNQLQPTFIQQLNQVWDNLEAICIEAGGGIDNIVKLGIYLQDLSHFPEVNRTMAERFGVNRPSRSTIEVSALPLGALIEMDAVFAKP